mgnify:CR=1 FL=1
MILDYLKKLKDLESDFASSQRKAFAVADLDAPPFYLCLSFFDNMEIFNMQDNNFEINRDIMKKNKLGTALVDICSNFNNIERIIYKYIRECENNQFENSDLVVTTKIITPMFLELGNSNKYFQLLKDFEYKEYIKELDLFKKRKKDILDFKEDVFSDMKNNIDDSNSIKILDDIIDTNNILIEYMKTQNIKTFTLDYLKSYVLELRQIKKLVDNYFCEPSNQLYDDFTGIKKLFLFEVIESPIVDFLFPISKVEPKIKINNNYINLFDFEGKYLYKSMSNDKEKNNNMLVNYLSQNDIKLFTTYRVCTIKELLTISFIEILKSQLVIKKCKNCGKYFIPESRTDEKYCNNPSPQNPNKTCKEYGAKKTYRDEIKSQPVKSEHNKTSQFYRMRINRAKNEKEKSLYEKKFNTYKEQYKNKKEQYKQGKLKEADFIEWIIKQKVGVKNGSTRNNKK